MTYTEALEYIHSIPKFVRPLGNADLSELLKKLGDPHKGRKYIHIAGTNGKGSVASMTASVLAAAGYKTGLFTSPFIECFNERIRINGGNIPDDRLAEYTELVKRTMEENGLHISEFAFICAVAFLYYAEEKCDYIVLETGMGGKLDATNIIEKPLVCVLTSIGLDHMQYLGDTVGEIAAEKCGIIKEGATVVSEPNPETRDIIIATARKYGTEAVFAENAAKTENGFVYKGVEYELPLKGEYQKDNGAAVVEVINALRRSGADISDEALAEGLKNVSLHVRFEFVRDNVVIDGGHNIDGMRALRKSLEGMKYAVAIAMMSDKAIDECVKIICADAEFVTATQIPMPRCASAKDLIENADNVFYETDYRKALEAAIKRLPPDMVLCVCGSLYFAAAAKEYLENGQ